MGKRAVDITFDLDSPHTLTVVDLFCGAGGLSFGLKHSGFKVERAFDHFNAAVRTYGRNLGQHVTEAEISEDLALPEATVIAGGPPCQGFSSAGQRRPGDRRNTLVSVFASLIVKHRPLMFVFENVEGFLTAEDGDRVLDLLVPLVNAGYRIHLRKINAANLGVPQHRKRVLGIGALGWDPNFPDASHSAFGAPGAHLAARHLPQTPSLIECLAGLPPPSVTLPGNPQGHFAAPLDDDDLTRVRALRQGQTMRDLPQELWHESYRRRAFRRVMDGTPTEKRGGAPCGIRRLVGAEPCKAITSGTRTEFVHPLEDRYMTLRECARVQTFPDDFEFVGSQADQALLIGNAVPPMLGEVIGRHLIESLARAEPRRSPGALLSFVPTLSAGMSPALERTQQRVQAAFSKHTSRQQMELTWD